MKVLFFDGDSIPEKLTEDFKTDGALTIWKAEKEYLAHVADMELYLFLVDPRTVEGLKFNYYPDFDLSIRGTSEAIPDGMIESALEQFMNGYNRTFKRAYYMQELENRIWPLSKSDENIKVYTLKMAEEIHRYQLKFIAFGFDQRNDFERLGEQHGFYAILKSVINDHEWAFSPTAAEHPANAKKTKRVKPPTISEDRMAELSKVLADAKVTLNGQLLPKGGPVIAILLNLLASKFGISKAKALELIQPCIDTTRPEKNFTISRNKDIRILHEKTADKIFSSVFR